MLFERELSELRDRKVALQMECDLRRGVLAVQTSRMRAGMDAFARGTALFGRIRPFLPVLVPLAGYLFARKGRTVMKWGGRAALWKIVRFALRAI